MNLSKVISSKSSLVGLKAELLKKQEEVKRIKELQQDYIKPISKQKKKSELQKTNEGVEIRNLKDVESVEDFDSLKKSREVLEAKSRLYEKLKNVDGKGDSKSQYLIDFGLKQEIYQKHEATKEKAEEESILTDEDEKYSDSNSDPENDWVDYVDTLGRSRRCLRKDLQSVKAKDAKLAASLRPPSPPPSVAPTPEMLSWDMQREIMRKKWEEQETALLGKKDIHYQDVRFDEARPHGVGYFDFSMDENERLQQQQALKNLRTETLEQQEAAVGLRARRQQQLQARLAAAHRRRRERLGLPPEDPELPCETENTTSVHVEEQRQEEKIEDIEESIKKITPVRPWDIGKQGINCVMSQEEWVEIKRQERPTEFAPPNFSEINNMEPQKKNKGFFDSKETFEPSKEKSNHCSKTRENVIVTNFNGRGAMNNALSSENCNEESCKDQNTCQNDSFESKTSKASTFRLKHLKKTSEQIDALLSNSIEKSYYCHATKNSKTNSGESGSVSSENKTGEVFGGPTLEDNWKTFEEHNRSVSFLSKARSDESVNHTVKDNTNKECLSKLRCPIVDEISLKPEKKPNSQQHNTATIIGNQSFINNCESLESFTVKDVSSRLNTSKRKWAEIAPPASMSYYTNDAVRTKQNTSCSTNLEDSISIGLNFLKTRTQEKDKKKVKGLLDII